jgi:glycosyltransferase involved in cell wall biosynthesis
MKVSVVTVTYNAEKVLAKTMESVLDQTCHDYEYLVVDGKSTDGTMDVVRDFESRLLEGEFGISREQLRCVSEPDKGLYDAMNKAIGFAKGEFVWFINAGDKVFSLDTLQMVVDAIDQNPDTDVVYGQTVIIGENDEVLGERHRIAPANLSKKSLLDGLVVCHQSVIVRRSIAPQYDLGYKLTADYDWMCRVLDASRKNVYIDDYLSKFQTAGLSSQRRKQSLKERFVIMKRHFGLFPTLWSHLCILLKYPFVTRKHVY